MFGKNKKINQQSKDCSPNINNNTGSIDVQYYVGATEEELKAQIQGVLWESFPRLQAEAMQTSTTYVREFISDIFSKIADGDLSSIEKSIKDPEKMTVITEALRAVAKRTRNIDTDTLSDLLIAKIQNDDDIDDEAGLILNQCINATSKISKTHVAFLGYVYFIKNVNAKFYGKNFNNIRGC